jgi:ribonuclease R
MGDKVRIKVIAANLEKRQLDYEWVLTATIDEAEEATPEKPKHKPKRKKKKTED